MKRERRRARRNTETFIPRGAWAFSWLALCVAVASTLACSSETRFETKTRETGAAQKSPAADKGSAAGTRAKAGVIRAGNEDNAHKGALPGVGSSASSSALKRWSLPVSQTADRALEIDLATGLADTEVTLASIRTPFETKVSQPIRALGSSEKVQGSPRKTATEKFDQGDLGVLDILVVVDDSGSMKEEQEGLAPKLSALLSAVKDSNWRIGVISTDADKSTKLRALIQKSDAHPETLFHDAILVGLAGSGNERGVKQAVVGLGASVPGGTASWLRPSSTVAVLIVSDEDNCSKYDTDCKGQAWDKESYLVDFLSSIREVKKDARVYGIFGVPGVACSTAGNTGVTYQKLVDATGGKSGSICDADYAPTLNAISSDLKSLLKSQYALKAQPEAGSVSVKVDGNVQAGFTLMGTTLEFNSASLPPPGSAIEVSYAVPASPAYFTSLKLPEVPGYGTLSVQVDKQVLTLAQYSLDVKTNTVSFGTAPVEGARVLFRWKSGELSSRIPVNTPEYSMGAVDIRDVVDAQGAIVQGAMFDDSKGELVLPSPPPEGAEFRVRGTRTLGPRLDYPVTSPLAGGRPVSVRDASGKVLDAKLEAGKIILKPSDVKPEAKVRVAWIGYVDGAPIPLDANVQQGSVEVKIGETVCSHWELKSEGLVIEEAGCPVPNDAKISVVYKVSLPLKKIPFPSDLSDAEAKRMTLVREGNAFTAFHLEGRAMVVDSDDLFGGVLVATVRP